MNFDASLPILTTVIAFGVLSVAACALCNTIGMTVHAVKPNEGGDLEYVYALDSAHQFREELQRFPSFQLWVFVLAAIAVFIAAPAVIAKSISPWTIVLSGSGYILLIVMQICRKSQKMYEVLQNTQAAKIE